MCIYIYIYICMYVYIYISCGLHARVCIMTTLRSGPSEKAVPQNSLFPRFVVKG